MIIQSLSLIPKFVGEGEPTVITVGAPVVAGGHVVEKITYHPAGDLYNKGKEVGQPGYSIAFVGIPERRFIVERLIGSLQLCKEPKTSNIPDLPA